MKTRILSVEEWPDAAFEDQPATLPYVDPDNVALVVVENDEGEIIARLGVYRVSYLEGLWIAPKYRGNAGVLRALLRQASALPKIRGEDWALGSSTSEEMSGYLNRWGKPIPVNLFALWVRGDICHKQQ